MTLIELTSVPVESLPVDDLAEHLRLSNGFSSDPTERAALANYLLAAIGAIEARTGKALVRRQFEYRLAAWRDLGDQVLPVAPVTAIDAFAIIDRNDVATVADPQSYRLIQDTHRPRLRSTGFYLPVIPVGGLASIRFTAGYSDAWSGVPGPLRQAVIVTAASFHEQRTGAENALPADVILLIEPFRVMRLFGGGAA